MTLSIAGKQRLQVEERARENRKTDAQTRVESRDIYTWLLVLGQLGRSFIDESSIWSRGRHEMDDSSSKVLA